MMIIKKNNENINNAFQKEEEKEPQTNEINTNMNLEGAEIETVPERRDDYNEGKYNKKGKNYKNNDKYYDKYNDNRYHKNKDKNYYNNDNYDYYGYKDYGGKKNNKGGYNDYDYGYGNSYKKKNYYKGGYK